MDAGGKAMQELLPSLSLINEHLETVFNAAVATQIEF